MKLRLQEEDTRVLVSTYISFPLIVHLKKKCETLIWITEPELLLLSKNNNKLRIDFQMLKYVTGLTTAIINGFSPFQEHCPLSSIVCLQNKVKNIYNAYAKD